MAANAAIVTLALSRSGAEDRHTQLTHRPKQLSQFIAPTDGKGQPINQIPYPKTLTLWQRPRRRNSGGTRRLTVLARIFAAAVSFSVIILNNDGVPQSLFSLYAHDTFFAFAIVSVDASPMSAPSSQILNLLDTISRISRSSLPSILQITSFPPISLSIKRYKPFEYPNNFNSRLTTYTRVITSFCGGNNRKCCKTFRTFKYDYHSKDLFTYYSRVGK